MLVSQEALIKIEKIINNYLDKMIVISAGSRAVAQERFMQLVRLGLVGKDVEAIFSTWGMPFLSEEKRRRAD